jgi:integrase
MPVDLATNDDRLYKVRACRLSSGERLPLVVDRRGIPVPLPNRWAMLLRRPQVQEKTLADEMRTIAHVHEWASRREIDLDQRFESGNGLRPFEVDALYQNLRYKRPDGRSVAGSDITDASLLNVVDWKTHAARVATARNYLTWALEQRLYHLDVADPRMPAVRERCELIRRQSLEFQRSAVSTSPSNQGLSRELRKELLDIIEPKSPRNPFSNRVRFRNYVLILLLMTFGFRRGEALKLKMVDLKVRGRNPTINIVRRPEDPDDTRANPPAVKTLGRELPLHAEMASILNEYVQHHRAQYLNADDCPYLFISGHGQPLSLRMVNTMIETLVRKNQQFAGLLRPHILRYTYNDTLRETADAEGVTSQEFQAAQNYLNGWSITSRQGMSYSRRANEERAREISAKHQERILR